MDCAHNRRTPGISPTRQRRWALAGMIALLGLTLTVRLLDPTGWLGSDDSGYFAAAEHILHGEPIQRVHHHYARMAVIIPVAASIAIFGSTAAAVWFPSLLASLLCVMTVAWTGWMLWGWREGLLAALIVSMVPYFRILSTAGFPDVHVCLWTAGSLALAVRGLRCTSTKNIRWFLLASGFCVAIATLTKILTAPAVVAVVLLIFQDRKRTRPQNLQLAGVFCAGGVVGIIIEGLFFQWAAGDFLFNYHAHLAALGDVPTVGIAGASSNASTWNLALDRLTMMLIPIYSGWGTLGMGFWIACGAGLWFRSTRWLAVWSISAYLLLAICPIGIKNGAIRLNPVFHGRHILPLCIPFALCIAHSVGRVASARFIVLAKGAFPIAVACVLGLAVLDRHHLSGFIHRPTSRVGIAIAQLIEDSALDDSDAPIFMTPSTYWRYRILFPQRLRSRLAVSTDPGAPDWWKRTTCDITRRHASLPDPDSAYLIATPRQLRGLPEQWDYGVSLPNRLLGPWRKSPPRVIVARLGNRTIKRVSTAHDPKDTLVMLLGGDAQGEAVATLRP